MVLEPSFLSNIAELTYVDPEFDPLLHRAYSFDAIFRFITVHSVDLLYSYPRVQGIDSFASLLVKTYMTFYLLNCIAHVWRGI